MNQSPLWHHEGLISTTLWEGEPTEEVKVDSDSREVLAGGREAKHIDRNNQSTRTFQEGFLKQLAVLFWSNDVQHSTKHTLCFSDLGRTGWMHFSSQETTCVIASGLFLSPATKATYLFQFHFQSGAAAAVRRLVQDNSRKQGVCSPSPGLHPPPQVLIGVGSAPGVILRFTSQWLAKWRPVEKVWDSKTNFELQEWQLSSLELLDLILAQFVPSGSTLDAMIQNKICCITFSQKLHYVY